MNVPLQTALTLNNVNFNVTPVDDSQRHVGQ